VFDRKLYFLLGVCCGVAAAHTQQNELSDRYEVCFARTAAKWDYIPFIRLSHKTKPPPRFGATYSVIIRNGYYGGKMSEDNSQKMVPNPGGVFNDLASRIKLIFRLMSDSRVSPLLKLLPVASVLYFIVPDLAIGPIDDVAVVWLGSYLFVELCPPEVVEEHLAALRSQPLTGEWRDPVPPTGEVIEGEYTEKKSS
jgi:hypothetical protein